MKKFSGLFLLIAVLNFDIAIGRGEEPGPTITTQPSSKDVIHPTLAGDPNDSLLTPTLVSLDLKNASVQSAILALSNAGNCSASIPKFPPHRNGPINLVTHDEPLLAAILKLESQVGAPISLSSDANPAARSGLVPVQPGIWTTGGPFALVVENIYHTIAIGRDGQPSPEFRNLPAENLSLYIACLSEPKLRILKYPSTLEIETAVDDRGHALSMDTTPPFMQGRVILNAFDLALKYPPEDAGRTIKLLSGKAQFLVQLSAQTLSVNAPADNAQHDFGAVRVSYGKPVWFSPASQYRWQIKFDRGKATDEQWKALSAAFGEIELHVRENPKTLYMVLPFNQTVVEGDQVVVNFMIFARRKDSHLAAQQPPIPPMSLEIPTDVEPVTVSVSFHDLPLP